MFQLMKRPYDQEELPQSESRKLSLSVQRGGDTVLAGVNAEPDALLWVIH